MTKEYAAIMKELKDRFPEGTVKNNRYIPNQVYVDRLETAAESMWDKEIQRLDIRPDDGYVSAIVRVCIGEFHRDGYALETIPKDCNNNDLKTAVDKVVNGAFVDAIDSWQVGWISLVEADPSRQRDWGANPGISLLQNSNIKKTTSSEMPTDAKVKQHGRVCKNCGEKLTKSDIELLKRIPDQNVDYCEKHIPEFRLRKIRT